MTLSVEQVAELKRNLSTLRHDTNNNLSLMMAAVELIRRKPESAERLWVTFNDQPPKITETIAQFSQKLETLLHIRRD